MSVITEDRIRKLDTDFIASLIAENTTLKDAMEQQRTDMSKLHITIGGLECRVQQLEKEIKNLERDIQILGRLNRSGTP